MSGCPKVLVISIDPFNRSNGTGITLSNLFDGWEKESIAQIYMSDKLHSNDVCRIYYKLNPQVLLFDYWLRKMLSPVKGTQTQRGSAIAGVTLSKANKTLRNNVHLNLRALADFSPIILPLDLFKWIDNFNPDIIYCALGSGRMLKLTNQIAAKIKKPIVPHFMDDWPKTLYTQNELGGWARKLFDKHFNIMLSNSNGGLCISEQMVEEYKKRYQLPFSAFVNCVEESIFYEPVVKRDEDLFVVMYVGGLHLNRWRSILDISRAIDELNKMGKKITLKIYCPLNDKTLYSHNFTSFSSTKFEGSLSSDQVSATLKLASLLIHVESFEDNYMEYTRFSLSTKIPQYMAAGKAILGYGPQILASMQHILKADSGRVVHNESVEEISNCLLELSSNKDLLFSYATNGFKYASENHSKRHNGLQLKALLTVYAMKDKPVEHNPKV